MDEQFDKNLTDRVKDVFENYDDPLVHDSWLRLREKFPEKRRRRPVAWWWLGTAAAVLLLFFGIGLWMNEQQVPTKNIVYKKNKSIPSEPNRPAIKEGSKDNSGGADNRGTIKPRQLAAVYPRNKRSARPTTENTFAAQNNYRVANVPKTPIPQTVTGRNGIVLQPDSLSLAIGKAKDGPVLTAQTKNKSAADSANAIVQKPAKSINSMFANDQQLSKSNHTEKQKSDTKKVRFAVYAATYFNYAKGSDNQVNMGAGFTSDISLAKNLKLVTGISIGQNSLSYSSSLSFNTAVPAAASLLKAAASSHYSSFGYNVKTASPTLRNYNASLVGLDVPVNLKYAFDPQKSDTYILAGLSSGTFINETYTSQYSYPLQQTQDQTSRNSFNSFYFAKTLNVALGTGFNMGKNRIIVEPFLKYPLDGLGTQQLRFGAGGVNLKFNFKPAKK